MLADAQKGIIRRIDTITGQYAVAINSTLFAPVPQIPLGVDGVHILHDELYFTNLASSLFGRIAIDSHATAIGPAEAITNAAQLGDDFALAGDGTAYIGGNNTLWRVRKDGIVQSLVGGNGSVVVQGITSAVLARMSLDPGVLYMSTNGELFFSPAGADVHGGQILVVNVGLFY